MIFSFILKFRNKYLELILSLIFGMFGVLAFSPYNFWPASIISLTGLFIIIFHNTCKKAILNTLFWGIGFFSVGLHWVYVGIAQFMHINSILNIFIIILLIICLTFFPILFAISFTILRPFVTNQNILSFTAATLWSITEYLRGNTLIGFPWLQFGYTQIDGPIKGIAPILGVEGITFILIFISSSLALSIITTQLFLFGIPLIILILLWPLTWIQWYHLQPHRTTTISLVQGNIIQNLYWNPDNVKSALDIYLKHTFPLIGKTKIIIWPESAIPGNEIDHNKFLTLLDYQLRKYKTYLITGIIDTRLIKNNYYHYNSIIVLGDIISYKYPSHNRYNKHHLVLCSEKIPCQFFFKPLFQFFNIPIISMQQGYYLQPQLHIENVKITSSICYEVILGNQIRNNFKPNSDFLLTIANDAWFGRSIEPWQHFQMARMRALELGRPLLFCTNNGITAIISADGSIQSQVSQFISTVLTDDVIPTTGITPYSQFGIWWMIGIIIILIIYLIYFNKNKLKNFYYFNMKKG